MTLALVIVRLTCDCGQNGRLTQARLDVMQTRDDTRRHMLGPQVLHKVDVDEKALAMHAYMFC